MSYTWTGPDLEALDALLQEREALRACEEQNDRRLQHEAEALAGPRYTTTDIPLLAMEFLHRTEDTRHWLRWWKERAGCRNLLLRSRRPAYFRTADAEWDLDWVVDLLGEVEA